MLNFSVSRLERAAKSNKQHWWQNMDETYKNLSASKIPGLIMLKIKDFISFQ